MFFNILDHLKEAPADDWTEQFIDALDGKEAVKTKDIKPGDPNMPLTSFVNSMLHIDETMVIKEKSSNEALSHYVKRCIGDWHERLPDVSTLHFYPDYDYDNGWIG